MRKLKSAAALVAGGALLAGAMGLAGAGTAAADTITCSDTLPAHTNGNAFNDGPQQLNKLFGTFVDTATCSTRQFNSGLNGADEPSDS
ncbi:hypothetical protein [Streptomyces sp. URMC 124]|uniref:hypothetical protein n=1 Tax=Streptomyces sp. URMC 124 TaxID=3423405 RepID=UPI003F195D7F